MASPYQTFARTISSYQEKYAEAGPSSAGPSSAAHLDTPLRHDVVLDEQGGVVSALMQSLEQLIRAKPTGDMDSDDSLSPEEKDSLLKEHRTWQLLRTVYDNRLYRSNPTFTASSASEALAGNPYMSPEELTQYMVDESDELSLFAILVEHLQSRPLLTESPPIESRHGYLPSTVRRAKAARLDPSSNTPQSLDPDFTIRAPHGHGLAGEDQTYQTPLLETLYDLVRHGELDQAIRVCEEGGEPWRAASLMGGRRWTMSGMTKGSLGGGSLEGNRTRTLWKKTCRTIAKNPTLSSSERHLYAALVTDLPNLYPALCSWEDYLWAHLQHRMESRLEKRWRELGGFWQKEEQGISDDLARTTVGEDLDDIFASIGNVQKPDIQVARGDPYIVAQRMIILGKADLLLEQFADRIPGLDESIAPGLVGPLLRFFTHLALVLRTLGEKVSDSAANVIIQAYLHVLEREGSDQLVAMYAACLRQGSGEESYARFLKAMDPNTTREAKMEALSRAKQHDLDVSAIARETVRLILGEAFATIPALSKIQPDVASFATGLGERDVFLIRSIEWLTMNQETMSDALIRANAVARYFLALGQAGAAQSLLKTLPHNLALAIPEDEEECHPLEHEQYKQLFAVFACHELVDEVLSRQPKATASRVEHFNWQKSLGSTIGRVQQSTQDLLTSEWLSFHIPSKSENASQRKNELRRIRQIFIPDLVLRLHTLLMAHRSTFPTLLQQALDLTKIVASETYQIYPEFLDNKEEGEPYKLVAYLDRVREASLAALEVTSAV